MGYNISLIGKVAVPAILGLATQTVIASGVFQPFYETQLPVRSTNGIKTGDFDANGFRDIAVSDWVGGNVYTVSGTGGGSFGTSQLAVTIEHPTAIAVGDLNADGADDLIVNGNSPTSATVCMSNHDGTFTTGNAYTENPGLMPGVGLGDLDHNGRPELITTYYSTLRVQKNIGVGTFGAATSYPVYLQLGSIQFEDFNHDNKLDVLAVNPYAASVFLGNGDGTLQPEQIVGSRLASPSRPGIADFDRDGQLDLVMATDISQEVEIQFGVGDGSFNRVYRIFLDGAPKSVEAGDFNHDRMDDIVVLDISSHELKFLAGHGDGTFAAPDIYSTPYNPAVDWSRYLMTDDMNLDGYPDVITLTDFGVLSVMVSLPEPGAIAVIGSLSFMLLTRSRRQQCK